jgi:hypothetical protein
MDCRLEVPFLNNCCCRYICASVDISSKDYCFNLMSRLDDPYFPVPVRLETCGLLLAESLTLSWPVRVPLAAGVKVTLIVHLPLAGRLVPQVVAETAKSPLVEIEIAFSDTDCSLVSVKIFGGLVVPTFRAGYVPDAGASTAGSTPVPESGTVCVCGTPLSVKTSCPVRVPGADGVKVTFTLHVLPIARLEPQVLEATANSPPEVMLVRFKVAVPLFARVTIFAALVVPITWLANFRLDGVNTGMGN